MADENNGLERNVPGPKTSITPPGEKIFEIHIKGQLDKRWSEWFEGLVMKSLDNGEMVLFGPILDQAALMGILNKLSRLNLALLSVNEINKKDGLEE
jgi:hypothetical protein